MSVQSIASNPPQLKLSTLPSSISRRADQLELVSSQLQLRHDYSPTLPPRI